jgi:hypothetical protein
MRNKREVMELVEMARQTATNCGARFEFGDPNAALESLRDHEDVVARLRVALQKAFARTTTQTFTFVREDGSVAKQRAPRTPNGGRNGL